MLPAAARAAPPKQLYVSLGDSYASGYQPTGVEQGRNTRNGFANQRPAAFEQKTTLYPGSVPVAVAQVCEPTYYCAFRDIHARTDGYRLIAALVARTLPRRPT